MHKVLGVMLLSISAAAVAHANPVPSQQPQGGWTQTQLQAIDNWVDQFGEQFEDWFYDIWGPTLGVSDPDSGQSGGGTVTAPEFDPASMIAALTLLSGGLAVLRGRRAKR